MLTAFIFTLIGIFACLWFGFSTLASAHKIKFFRLRQEQTTRGWRLLLLSIFLGFCALFLQYAAEPIAYRYFPPTITLTITSTITTSPTITLKPTITNTPTITITPAESYTPTNTVTPNIPADIALRFTSSITPDPAIVFSELIFSTAVDEQNRPTNPGTAFTNPIKEMYALFSYDRMATGVQWSALWYRNGILVFFETYPWDGSTGGYGYSLWHPTDPTELQPGVYNVQIFVGTDWQTVGSFTLQGNPPTATITASPKPTIPTKTPKPTRTPRPTITPRPSRTPRQLTPTS